jgi:DNA-binding NtrC family response regulator
MGRILVIEDEPGAQILLQSRLQDLGHEVVTAPTGAMGLMEARAGGFDLFVVDVQLGAGVNGYEVCRRLKSMPGAQGVPLVLLSGRVRDRGELHQGYEAGCDAYLLKGEDPLIEDVVRAMLRQKTLHDELARQNQLLEQQNQRLERAGRAVAEGAAGADPAIAPDAVLTVDAEGVVTAADRGALVLFQVEVTGKHLGTLAPGTGLEAWVRDARGTMRTGHLFVLPERGGSPARRIGATVAPLPATVGAEGRGSRVLLLRDARGPAAGVSALAPWTDVEQVEELRLAFHPSALVGRSAAVVALRSELAAQSSRSQPLVLLASSAAQLRLLARILHHTGERRGRLVSVSCDVLEAEGAGIAELRSWLAHAAGGTLLLEEADHLTVHRRRALGELLNQGTDPRLLLGVSERAQESAQLAQELSLERLVLPPLRERPEDVAPLAEHFLLRESAAAPTHGFSDEALQLLTLHPWPGDVAELERCIGEACRTADGGVVEVADLPVALRELREEGGLDRGTLLPARPATHGIGGTHRAHAVATAPVSFSVPADGDLRLEMGEPLIIQEALRRTGQNVKEAANLLGIGRSTLYRKLKEHGLR